MVKDDFNLLKKKSFSLANPFTLEIRTQRHGQELARSGSFMWLVSECAHFNLNSKSGALISTHHLPAGQVSAPRSALLSFNGPTITSVT